MRSPAALMAASPPGCWCGDVSLIISAGAVSVGGLNDSDRFMNRSNNDILFVKKPDKVVSFEAAGMCVMLIAVNAAVLELMLTFFRP